MNTLKNFIIFFVLVFALGCSESGDKEDKGSNDAAVDMPSEVTPVDAADAATPTDAPKSETSTED